MSFFETLRTAQQKFLRPSLYVLVLAATLYPLMPSPTYKYIVLYVLANVVIRCIFDIESNLSKKLGDVQSQLGTVREVLEVPNPPTWRDYTSAQNDVLQDIEAVFDAGENVCLDIIGYSGLHPWRMVEDKLSPVMRKYDKRSLAVNIGTCTRDTLDQWALASWAHDLDRTISGMRELSQIHHEAVEAGRLVLRRFEFDILPQWHGVLINGKVLYIGRTEWVFHSDSPPTLLAAQCAYRRFEIADRYGGHTRIAMFANWIERLRRRHDEIHNKAT